MPSISFMAFKKVASFLAAISKEPRKLRMLRVLLLYLASQLTPARARLARQCSKVQI